MADRSLVTIIAALGGILVIIGGILGLLLGFGPYGYGPRFVTADIIVLAVLSIIFGVVIIVYSGFTHVRGANQTLTGGLVLIILGIVTWVIGGAWILVSVGAALTIIAGIVLILWIALGEPRMNGSHSS
jgi:hypothetical protein